ncbi:MAG TPA: DUF2950 family protein, partial [Gemmatimonadales bacterium]|nr:DUF2950 family protein [Gemmatimonadales bacterium]
MSAVTSVRMARIAGAAAVLCGLLTACGDRKPEPKPPERQFATPEEAAAALVDAAERFDRPALTAMLGPDGEDLVASEDSVADRNRLAEFAAEARQHLRVELDSAQTSAVLSVGASDWPLPIPVVQREGRWFFDA